MTERYTTLRPIASGGMGTVYLGRREGLGGFSRLVALKRAHPDLASKPSVQRRFVREASAASMLHHANVVAVVDLFTQDGDSWLVLDWVDGVSLSELLSERGQLPARVAIHVILDACAGLAAAHELRVDDAPLGLQHRDVSPGNILVGRDGVSRIADFGLARTFDTTLTNTDDRFLEGKLGYLAPELFQGKDFDERCDLYALGVVAWEALAGMRLFRAKSLTKLMAEQKAPTRLAAIYPALAWLDPVIDRAMAFEPARRASTVREFMTELARVADEHGMLGTADDVSRFMRAAETTGTPIAELSAKTPITSSSLDPTPTTGPLLRDLEPMAPEVSSSDIVLGDALSSASLEESAPAIATAGAPPLESDELDAPTPPPPHRPSFAALSEIAAVDLKPVIEAPVVVGPLAVGSFLASVPKLAIDDPVSFDSTRIPGTKPRAGLWLSGLIGVAAISVALIAATQSDDAPSSLRTTAIAAPTPPPIPTLLVAVSALVTSTAPNTAIVIGHEEARSARVRVAGAPPSTAANLATEAKPVVVPPATPPTTGKSLPDNPYRKKYP